MGATLSPGPTLQAPARPGRRVDVAPIWLLLLDALIAAAWLLGFLWPPTHSLADLPRAVAACTLAWAAALVLTELIGRRRPRRRGSTPRQFLILALSAMAAFQTAALLEPALGLPSPYAAVAPPLALIAALHWGWHLYVQHLRPGRVQGLLFAPSSALTPLIAQLNVFERSLGVSISGVMGWDDHFPRLGAGLPQLFDDIVAAMRDCEATVLVLTMDSITSMSGLEDLRWQLENEGLRLGVVVDATCLSQDQLEITSAPGVALLQASARRDTLLEAFSKRAFDLVVSSLLIVLLAPLWLVLGYLIRRQDGGPAFFLQERVGRDGTTFPMVKFRTMVTNAELMLEDLRAEGPDTGVLFKLKCDPRITPLGSFLRRSSVDELPQLFNVWLGHMSLVGPRPPLPREVAQYLPRVMRKFNVRPGMTGLWQVSGRSNLSWDESVRLDLHYVEHRSLAFDILILIKTVGAVLYQDGAY